MRIRYAAAFSDILGIVKKLMSESSLGYGLVILRWLTASQIVMYSLGIEEA